LDRLGPQLISVTRQRVQVYAPYFDRPKASVSGLRLQICSVVGGGEYDALAWTVEAEAAVCRAGPVHLPGCKRFDALDISPPDPSQIAYLVKAYALHLFLLRAVVEGQYGLVAEIFLAGKNLDGG